jgi:hypothetical protein
MFANHDLMRAAEHARIEGFIGARVLEQPIDVNAGFVCETCSPTMDLFSRIGRRAAAEQSAATLRNSVSTMPVSYLCN